MPDSLLSKVRNLPPIKRKRKAPPDAARQLSAGCPSPKLEGAVWNAFESLPQALAVRYGADRFEPARYIHEVALALEELARVRHWQPGLFSVYVDNWGNRYLSAERPVKAALKLFTRVSREKALLAMAHYAEHDFHPYFSLLVEAIQRGASWTISGQQYKLEDIADRYLSSNAFRPFFNDVDIYLICDAFNAFFANLYQSARDARERVKSFRRVAHENRRRLMQYTAHLIDNAPSPTISHITIRRDARVIGGGSPITRDQISDLREKFVRHIKEAIPKDDYLGCGILLKGDAVLGYWLEAFVFFSSNALQPAADVVDQLVGRWNGQIGPGHAGCIGEILAPEPFRRELLSAQALERITFVTEPDFYCRVPAMGLRRFWCTQSPVGKLAERTKQRKRLEAEEKKRRKSASQQTALGKLIEEAFLRDEREQAAHWEAKRKETDEKRSAKRTKAAKKRLRLKGTILNRSAVAAQQDRHAKSKASAGTALSEEVSTTPDITQMTESNSSDGSPPPNGAGPVETASAQLETETTLVQGSAESSQNEGAVTTPATASASFPPIQLERRTPRDTVANASGSERRVSVEMRAKRRERPKPVE